MKVTQPADTVFCKIAGKQPDIMGKSRMFKYVITQPVADGTLLFNTLTCELLHLTKDEYSSLSENSSSPDLRSSLSAKWFLVPEDFNDKLFVKHIRVIYRASALEKGVHDYTILTTTDCNARCFYCFEKGCKRIPMTQETAEKVADNIISNWHSRKPSASSRDLNSRKPVHLGWTGGEPLHNYPVIDIICQRLNDAGVPYTSHMISNASLFTPEIVEKARTLWNLKVVQIALDGTEEKYNRIKAYVDTPKNSDGSSVSRFQQVLHNIQMLMDAHIHASVRLNVDKHNIDNLMMLVDELENAFVKGNSSSDYVDINCFMLSRKFDNASSDEEYPEIVAKFRTLREKIARTGRYQRDKLPTSMNITACADTIAPSYTIAPTGQIGFCTVYTDSHFYGNIAGNEKVDEAKLEKYSELKEDDEVCDDCPRYPQCQRLKHCPEAIPCNKYEQESLIWRMKQAMLNAYKPTTYKIYALLDKFVAVGTCEGEPPIYIKMDQTGKEIFELHLQGKTQPEIVSLLLQKYDATEEQIATAVRDFLK